MSLGGAVAPGPNMVGKKQLSIADTFRLAWADPDLRQRLTFVLACFAAYALLVHITTPIPGVSPSDMANLLQNNQFLQMLNQFGGGAFRRLSIISLGLGPYITASIILQVLTYANPVWKQELQEGGEYARKQQNRRTRALTLVLCVGQSLGFFHAMTSALGPQSPLNYALVSVFWTAGSMLLLWMGEQITEKGIGNGVSLLIFMGIVISIPNLVNIIYTNFGVAINWWQILFILAVFGATTYFVVLFTQAQRRIPIQHMRRNYGTKQLGGQTSYLPISVNMAGVIPIIFAVALIYMPSQVAGAIPAGTPLHDTFQSVALFLSPNFTRWEGLVGALVYTLMIFGFTFVWNAMTYNVEDIANNLKRAGSYIPGIRPGKQTRDFLNGVITRVTFVGALFLAAAALTQYIFPVLVPGIPNLGLLAGTSLLIMVSVALETMRQIEANLLVKQYGG
ncbi:MAG: preprotein translocase subunit SecY [Fimbriimonadaceae bacterium]|nr:preprotein translocase subunit SecY [Fimbriimonadaceae bacterium]